MLRFTFFSLYYFSATKEEKISYVFSQIKKSNNKFLLQMEKIIFFQIVITKVSQYLEKNTSKIAQKMKSPPQLLCHSLFISLTQCIFLSLTLFFIDFWKDESILSDIQFWLNLMNFHDLLIVLTYLCPQSFICFFFLSSLSLCDTNINQI